MDSLRILQGPIQENISRQALKEMCKEMVRKDFEILRIQDALFSVFSNTEFYSKYDDELLSVKHTVELASGYIINKDSHCKFYQLISEAVTALIFESKGSLFRCLKQLDQIANVLVTIIFKSCEVESEIEAESIFMEAFKGHFPNIDVPFLDRREIELKDGVYCN